MTVNTTTARVSQNGDGTSRNFPVPFYFLQDDDLLVYLGGVQQTLTTHYTVSGAGSPGGGAVSFNSAPPPGAGNVVIIRDPDLLQGTKYPTNDPFPAKTHETALDKLTMLAQRTRDLISRAFTLADGDASSASLTVPTPQAGYLIGWNPTASGLANFANTGGGATLPLPVSVANGGTGAATAAAARASLGLGSAAALNVGTAAGNVVQLDGSAKIPALDGSQILNLPPPVRQTVQGGAVDANGYANWLSAGTGLTVNLAATAAPVRLAFANGYNDFITDLSADAANQFGALPPNNTAFLFADRASSGGIVGGNTIVPPQYGYAFDRTRAALLHFDGVAGATNFLDDWGNAWTAQGGAKLQSNQTVFGATAFGGSGANNALNGTSDCIKCTAFTSMGSGSWTIRARCNVTSSPAVNTAYDVVSITNASGYGATLAIFNVGGAVKFGFNISSTGNSYDVAAALGSTTPVLNTWYAVEVTFDAPAGVYRLYVNGVQETSQPSTARVCATTAAAIGARPINQWFFPGYIDEVEIVPYCDHPNGTTFTPASTPSTVNPAGKLACWFDIPSMTMREVIGPSTTAGSNPVFAIRNRVFVGEADAGLASIGAVRSYAYQGRWQSDDFAIVANSVLSKVHNLGVTPRAAVIAQVVCSSSDNGYLPGDVLTLNYYEAGSTLVGVNPSASVNKYLLRFAQPQILSAASGSSGTMVTLTYASWRGRFTVNRGW